MLHICTAHAATILVLGDSLSAGYGLADVNHGWVALLQQRLQQDKLPYKVVNASISGETTAGGLARLDASLDQQHPSVLLLELGANDGLRGLSLEAMKNNLKTIVKRARARGTKVVLIGMLLPPNLGVAYNDRFADVFHQLAKELRLPFVPFLLDGVALDPRLMQFDQLHPNEAAQRRLLDNVWPVLVPLLH